jgi:C4-dicarboxylate-specific signal transduction histidine kinase
MLGINLDITDYMKSKEISERRNRIEESLRFHIAGQTAAAIAHELNQPLTAISSYADVALHMLQTGNPHPQKLFHVIENCALQAQRAGQVMRQLLALLQQGEIVSEPVDINASIHEALDFVKSNGHPSKFNIELNCASGLPPVAANHLQIQKVLVNILQNALESIPDGATPGGAVTVTTSRAADNPTLAQVTVCDNGKGVADTGTLKTMFQPFYTTKTTGLGMGLAISRTLIEAHGGKMWATQNAGDGISVHFTLPFVS